MSEKLTNLVAHELPPLNALRAFEAVARLGSVSRASAELHVTHGAVSRQVHRLEAAAGTALLQRSGRGLVLTAAGRSLHEEVAQAFSGLRSSWSHLRQAAGLAPLVLGCSSSVLARWLIPRLPRLQHELPQLRLHLAALEEAPDAALTGVDAALLVRTPPWPPQWQVHELAGERIGPVLSPTYAHAHGLSAGTLDALCREPLLHTASRPQAWPAWAASQDIPADRLQPGRAFKHLYYLLEAAVAGVGVAIAPAALVAADLAAGRLLAPWGFVATDARWALCTHGPANPASRQALVDWLEREWARDDAYA